MSIRVVFQDKMHLRAATIIMAILDVMEVRSQHFSGKRGETRRKRCALDNRQSSNETEDTNRSITCDTYRCSARQHTDEASPEGCTHFDREYTIFEAAEKDTIVAAMRIPRVTVAAQARRTLRPDREDVWAKKVFWSHDWTHRHNRAEKTVESGFSQAQRSVEAEDSSAQAGKCVHEDEGVVVDNRDQRARDQRQRAFEMGHKIILRTEVWRHVLRGIREEWKNEGGEKREAYPNTGEEKKVR